MLEKLYLLADKILNSTFYILLFTIPFIFSPWNFELFEFNKMMLTYGLAVVIAVCWAIKSIIAGRFIFQRTLLDLPLLLFLLSQIISTLISIDIHTSIWGYYTRSNGGSLSTITYIVLYWAFVSNFDIRKTLNAKRYLLSSALIISIWGILEHFGRSPSCLILTGSFDASCWVQDVQNRVFATLGQPNWMAAFLVAVMPLAWALVLNPKSKYQNLKFLSPVTCYLLPVTFALALLFTKSRSGLLGFAAASAVFWGILLLAKIRDSRFQIQIFRPFLILYTLYSILLLLIGSPWTQSILEHTTYNKQHRTETGTVLERGGTESGEIRKIVWKGAIDIWRAYPLFGSGVETFAYSYYNFRPVEHNLTSEWNFLYNKAHNEYLNFLATTGAFGLGTYLLLMAGVIWQLGSLALRKINYRGLKPSVFPKGKSLFLFRFIRGLKSTVFAKFEINPNNPRAQEPSGLIVLALAAGYASILVTNFFGFSVVPVALLFFLYPAMAITLNAKRDTQNEISKKINLKNIFLFLVVLLFAFYVLLRLGQLWYADTLFAQADKLIRNDQPATAAQKLEQAINLNSGEPNYHDKLATAYSTIAATLAEENKNQDAKKFTDLAKQETDKAYAISPRNLSLLKSRASTFNRLALVDETYLTYVLITLERASILAPTDPTTNYNLGIAYYRTGKTKEAIETFEKLNGMKPDYADSHFALAEIYVAEGQKDMAREELKYILKNIDPENELAKKSLEKL